MTTQYIMKATHINSAPLGIVYWVSTGSADNTGANSGYNTADLTNISVDYTTTLVSSTSTGFIGSTVRNNPVKSENLGSGNDGYVLTWVNANSEWEAKPDTDTGGGGSVIAAMNNLRLTLATGVPVTTTDQIAKTTIYLTPYKSGEISLYTSSVWTSYTTAEVSIALGTLTSGKAYDVFAYYTGSAVALEFSAAWSSATARTDALARQNGVLVKSSDYSRRYLGTFYTTSTTTTEDSKLNRLLWNQDNAVERFMYVNDATATWTYAGAYRQARGQTANQVNYVTGDVDGASLIDAHTHAYAYTNQTDISASSGIGIDSTTVNSAILHGSELSATANGTQLNSNYKGYPGMGYHSLVWLEYASTATTTWVGTQAFAHSGLQAEIFG